MVGETGVGKSTFVNALANYCKFSSLEEAVQAGGVFPIPCTFEIIDPKTDETIRISSNGDVIPATSPAAAPQYPQAPKAGQSVTKTPDVYSVLFENTDINLIDTPGLLDTNLTEDPDADKKHVEEILCLLTNYHDIHAICILLKANQTRLTEAFQYTLTELFKLFGKDACNNIIFIFTYAACTNFKPGAAQATLQTFLQKNNVNIPVNQLTKYCVENDTMNYLAQCKAKIHQTGEDTENAQKNWTRSVNSKSEMFERVRSLEPYSLAGMHAIDDVRHTICVLSNLVLETLVCILKDGDELKQKKERAEAIRKEIKEDPAVFAKRDLKSLMVVTETKVVRKQLDYFNVVCNKCAKVVNGQIVYPQPCCSNCCSPIMYFCMEMDFMAKCKVCQCSKSKHEWVSFKTEVVTEIVERPTEEVVQPIIDSNDALNLIKNAITRCENRMERYDKETKQMLMTCAELYTFVRQNVLMSSSYDDELSKSLQNKIDIHERATDANIGTELACLKEIQRQYKTFLEKEKKKNEKYSKDDMDKLMQQLYELPMRGKDLKRAMDEEKERRGIIIEQVVGKDRSIVGKLKRKLHIH